MGDNNLPRTFFVYGTLRRGQGNHIVLGSDVTFLGEGTTRGKMYNVGYYPAVVLEGSTLVLGELYTTEEDKFEKLLQRLDRLEGYPRLYTREIVNVFFQDDRNDYLPVKAIIYVAGPLIDVNELKPIPSGDWNEFTRSI